MIISFGGQEREKVQIGILRYERQPTEEQLHLVLTADGKGCVELEGELSDEPGIGNQLRFRLQLGQTQLKESMGQLEQSLSVFRLGSKFSET